MDGCKHNMNLGQKVTGLDLNLSWALDLVFHSKFCNAGTYQTPHLHRHRLHQGALGQLHAESKEV